MSVFEFCVNRIAAYFPVFERYSDNFSCIYCLNDLLQWCLLLAFVIHCCRWLQLFNCTSLYLSNIFFFKAVWNNIQPFQLCSPYLKQNIPELLCLSFSVSLLICSSLDNTSYSCFGILCTDLYIAYPQNLGYGFKFIMHLC